MNVVFLHGFGEDATIWTDFLKVLPQKHTYFCPDYASLTHIESIDGYADWLKAYTNEKAITESVIIGHSMGGYIALAYAEKFADEVLGLGLFHSSAYADNEERKEIRLKTARVIDQQGTAKFIKGFYPNMFTEEFKGKNADFIEKQIERYAYFPKEALMNAQIAMRGRQDKTSVLKEADYPIMILAGEKDTFVPKEAALEQITLLKNDQSVVLEGVAHAGMFENPAESAKVVTAFLSKI
ncbi:MULTISPECIES: alpha/beta fold hydrolase [Emticicia]|uniref:alpha/beta fold hydrolase n=1 Tax=Emticicia TaxID=312278 RepID=UPI0007D8BF57|nr:MULTISPECIES: alpha/beta hydrolase [Emticicia]